MVDFGICICSVGKPGMHDSSARIQKGSRESVALSVYPSLCLCIHFALLLAVHIGFGIHSFKLMCFGMLMHQTFAMNIWQGFNLTYASRFHGFVGSYVGLWIMQAFCCPPYVATEP